MPPLWQWAENRLAQRRRAKNVTRIDETIHVDFCLLSSLGIGGQQKGAKISPKSEDPAGRGANQPSAISVLPQSWSIQAQNACERNPKRLLTVILTQR
jgi:hypothetical protein